ncbi:MAG: lysozyme [Candidatus Competibacteraceae bacterium]|nr:lysozyme [Candidatus Competibacteraceae bacterium]
MARKSRSSLSIKLSAAAIAAAVAVQVGDRGMSVSEAGVDLIMQFESCRVAVYRDPVGLPTAGCGHLVTADDDYRVGQKLTKAEIRELFIEDLLPSVRCVNKALGWKVIDQGDFDVFTDLAFNTGCPRFQRSTALRCYRRGDRACAKRGVAAFRIAGGRVNRGLVRRRTAFLEQRWGRP